MIAAVALLAVFRKACRPDLEIRRASVEVDIHHLGRIANADLGQIFRVVLHVFGRDVADFSGGVLADLPSPSVPALQLTRSLHTIRVTVLLLDLCVLGWNLLRNWSPSAMSSWTTVNGQGMVGVISSAKYQLVP